MTEKIKKFILDNEDLINSNEWEEVYRKADVKLGLDKGRFTETLLRASIHPEYYLEHIPKFFLFESDIKSFSIPNHITSIDESAFHSCSSLIDIEIPSNITSIGNCAFYKCSSLTSMIIPDSVANIGYSAFSSCQSLADVVIGNSVEIINDYAFSWCRSLLSIDIPESVKSIGGSAFSSFGSLRSVRINNPQIRLDPYVFGDCDDLAITFNGTKAQWKDIAKGKFKGVTYICNCLDGILKKSR